MAPHPGVYYQHHRIFAIVTKPGLTVKLRLVEADTVGRGTNVLRLVRYRAVVKAAAVTGILLAVFGLMLATARSADDDKRLDRVKGVIGFATAPDAPLHQIFGHELIPDDDYAVTREKSAALLALPDSSIVAIGEKTLVKVGAFSQTADGPGSTITVEQGTLRFDIRRPAGGTANYRFMTSTSQIAVRGTVGLLSFIGGNTTVACLVCAADSVTVTVGAHTVALLTGQFLTVSALGAVVTGTVTGTVLGTFTGAQVSTVAATGSSAATAGVAGAAGAAGGAVGGVAAGTVAGAAAGAAVAGVAISTLAAKPSPSPAPSATPNAIFQTQSLKTAPAPAPPAQAETPRPLGARH